MASENSYLKSLEDSYKQDHSGRNVLFIGSKSLFLSGDNRVNDEQVGKTIDNISKQIASITSLGINPYFLTDFLYRGLCENLGFSKEQFFFSQGDLIDSAFEIGETQGITKVIYLTKKSISGIVYGQREKLNYINPHILRKIEIIGKFKGLIEKILGLLDDNQIGRFHFVNILRKSALYNELFTLYGEGKGDGVLVSLNYRLDLDKLKSVSEDELLFLYHLLTELAENDGYVKGKELPYIIEHIDNFYVYKIDGASVGMFEVKNLGLYSKEVGTVILDPNFQGGGIGYRMVEKIMELKSEMQYKYFNFIIVTGNKNLKSILDKFEECSVVQDDEVCDDLDLQERYNTMLEDNKKDGKNREMFIIRGDT